jgi:hypothetical protein
MDVMARMDQVVGLRRKDKRMGVDSACWIVLVKIPSRGVGDDE